MAGRRDQIARVLERFGVLDVILRGRARLDVPVLSVLCYHRVSEKLNAPYDSEVIDALPEQFEHQMSIVAKHFNTIGVEELVAYLHHGSPLPPNPCLITFDDGYRDCIDIAYPILKRNGLKAVFFIATDYVSERRAYWWDRIHYLMNKSKLASIALSYPEEVSLKLGEKRVESTLKLLRIVKDTKGLELERFLDALAAAAEVEWDRSIERAICDELVMSWDDVRALRAGGMDIGSHTRSHRVLHTVNVDELGDELKGSRDVIESELGESVVALAYPVGKTVADKPEIMNAVKEAGYQVAFTNLTGHGRLSRAMDPLNVPRLGMDKRLSNHLFRGMMAIPQLTA